MNAYEVYQLTLPYVATENAVMGITLLLTYRAGIKRLTGYRTSMRLIAFAMLVMAVINYAELWIPSGGMHPMRSFSIIVMAASIEMFLLWYSYMAILNKNFITRFRTGYELSLIAVFTIPPLLVDPEKYPLMYELLFYISIAYYAGKFGFNLWVYMNHYFKAQGRFQNFYSGANVNLLNWVHNTFVVVMSVGVVSIIVPLTNYTIMALYQIFLFCAYLYLYVSVIRHLGGVEADIERVPQDMPTERLNVSASNDEEVLLPDVVQPALQEWIEKRQYAKPGITIEEVAAQLGVNRTLLSKYLNVTLNQSFYTWITYFRIEDAKRALVENPTLPIIDIGTFVGIEDRSNFDKVFKRFVGMSPALFRIEYGKSQLHSMI